MQQQYLPRQRDLSFTEPEQGLGVITHIDGKQLSIYFPNANKTRNYGTHSAPLKRITFEVGDRLRTESDQQLVTIKALVDKNGLIYYQTDQGEFCEDQLQPLDSFNRPHDKIFYGASDSLRRFELRLSTFKHALYNQGQSEYGLLGARVSLINHQLSLVQAITQKPLVRAMLADEVGLGKTIEAGLLIHRLLVQKKIQRLLILVPASLTYQWFIEMFRKYNLSFSVINEDHGELAGDESFDEKPLVICSQAYFLNSPGARAKVAGIDWDMLVVDEVHKIDSEQLIKIEELTYKTTHVLFLSATPKLGGESLHQKRLSLLTHLGQEPVLVRNTRQDLISKGESFPARYVHPYPLTSRNSFDSFQADLSEAMLVAKTTWLVEHLHQNSSKKFLFIVRSKAIVLRVEQLIAKYSSQIKTAIFHSDLSLVARDRHAAYFSEAEGAQILLCTEIGSEGRNFAFVQDLIFFDLPTSADLVEQRIGRLDRIGQRGDVHLHIPFIENSWEKCLFELFNQGLDLFQKISGVAQQILNVHGKKINDQLASTSGQWEEGFLENMAKAHKEKILENQFINTENASHLESFEQGLALIKAIKDRDESEGLANFLDEIYHEFGVECEELFYRSYFIRPGENMFIDSFPALDSEGMSYTFDRSTALTREDLVFMSWEHPLVEGIMDYIMGSEFGNMTVVQRRKRNNDNRYLEAYFKRIDKQNIVEYQRVLIDKNGNDLTGKWTPEFLQDKIEPALPSLLDLLAKTDKSVLKNLVDQSQSLIKHRGGQHQWQLDCLRLIL